MIIINSVVPLSRSLPVPNHTWATACFSWRPATSRLSSSFYQIIIRVIMMIITTMMILLNMVVSRPMMMTLMTFRPETSVSVPS